jgi:hypothetical protein
MRFSGVLPILSFFLLWGMTPAFAANDPAGAWTVGPIRATSSSGLSYCSMKNDFPSGHKLVFARDGGGLNSLAIDFGKKIFTPGAQSSVILETGSLSHHIMGIAATDGIIIVQLGKDLEFYDTMRKQDILQISFPSQSIGFGLKGSAEGLKALDECTAAIGAGGGVYVEKMTAQAVPESEKKKMSIGQQAFDTSMQEELEKLRLENRRLLLEKQKAEAQLIAEENSKPEKDVPTPAKKSVRVDKKPERPLKKDDGPEEMPAVPAPSVEAAAPPEKKNTLLRLFDEAAVSPRLEMGTYVWDRGDVRGAAEMQSLATGQTINHGVGGYIDFAKQRCDGDFAYRLGAIERIGAADTMQGEMACIDGKTDAATALLFVTEEDRMYILTEETGAANVAQVLEARDALFSKLSGILK